MSQSDLALPLTGVYSGLAIATEINEHLAALATLSSGASAPTPTFANQLWYDTTNGVLKKRNNANTTWELFEQSVRAAKTSNYTVVLSDHGTLIEATSGTWTLSLTAAATLGSGFWCLFYNSGSGVVTIDPNGSETINGATTLLVGPGCSILIECNGSGFYGALTAPANAPAEASLASASTVNIGAAAQENIYITGTTTITAFDTVAAGIRRSLRFAGALTFTHNATSMILPGGANITTASNDTCEMMSLGSGNWICLGYKRQNGQSIASSSSVVIYVQRTGSAQSITSNTDTKIQFNGEIFDDGGYFDSATNYEATNLPNGKYLVILKVTYSRNSGATSDYERAQIRKNGSVLSTAYRVLAITGVEYATTITAEIIDITSTSNTIQGWAFSSANTPTIRYDENGYLTTMLIAKLP
jgi:hypothetical protein